MARSALTAGVRAHEISRTAPLSPPSVPPLRVLRLAMLNRAELIALRARSEPAAVVLTVPGKTDNQTVLSVHVSRNTAHFNKTGSGQT